MTDQSKQKITDNRWWDFLAALLLIIAMLTSATRLVATKWVSQLSLVQNIAVWGTLAGLALGKSKFPRWLVFLFTVAYGIYVIPWQLGLTMAEGIEWRERLISMAGRIQMVIQDILAHRDVQDNLFFLMLMALLYWVIGVYAGFQLVRNGSIWRAILPAGLAVFVIHAFDSLLDSRAWYLPVYIFLSLMLLARVNFLRQRKKWEAARTHIPADVGLDLGRIALGISVVIIFVAWNAPVLSSTISGFSDVYNNLNRPWLSFKDRMSFMFASLRASVGFVSNSFGNVESLGLGSPKTNAIVMTIDGPKYPYVGARYYYRARVYDEYNNGTWKTNLLSTTPFAPDKNYFKQEPEQGRFDAVFRITPYTAIRELYLPSQPVWASRPGQLQYGAILTDYIDMVALQAVPYIRPGETYEARSSLASVTQYRMKNAGTIYPQWVTDRYLQLPENITPRTRELAKQIAQGLDNPYDIAEAVTDYLRNNISYQVTIDPPPTGQEVIDWFLFDYKKGFCNYYSTAEVILLRSLGIPARWAVGYAEGERVITQEELNTPRRGQEPPDTTSMDIATFNVRQKDAHAWPEVYFPNMGWVEFEPTTSLSPIVRPIGQSSNPSAGQNPPINRNRPELEPTPPVPEDTSGADSSLNQNQGWRIRNVIFGMLLILVAGIIIFSRLVRNKKSPIGMWWENMRQRIFAPFPVQVDRSFRRLGLTTPGFIQRWANYVLMPALGRAYQEINKALQRLNKPLKESATPAERIETLTQVLPAAAEPAHKLLREYELDTYSPHTADVYSARLAGNEIRRLSIAARFRGWFSWIFSKPLK